MALDTSATVLLGQELTYLEGFILQKLGLVLVSGLWCSSTALLQEEGESTQVVSELSSKAHITKRSESEN